MGKKRKNNKSIKRYKHDDSTWDDVASESKVRFRETSDPKIFVLGSTPRIIVNKKALDMMEIIVERCKLEVGWLGTVSKINESTFHIEEVFLPEQEVSAASTDLMEDGMAKLVEKLLAEGRDDAVSKLRFWGHSHVNMGISPSTTDDSTMKEFEENGCEFFVRAIMNKRGEAKFDLYDYKRGISYINISWSVETPRSEELETEIKKLVDDNVKEKRYDTGYYNNGYYDNGYGYGGAYSSRYNSGGSFGRGPLGYWDKKAGRYLYPTDVGYDKEAAKKYHNLDTDTTSEDYSTAPADDVTELANQVKGMKDGKAETFKTTS